jgi:hypothetical protein
VATTSDSTATTLDLYAQLLKRLGTNADPAVLPILSSVGEPRNPAPLRDRSRRLVVFGGAGARRRGYALGEPLRKACQALEIEEVLDIGPPVDRLPSRGPGVPIRSTGALRTEEVGALLGESMAGFLVYPSEFLPKSTIFAAYCAHGMLPICASSRPQGPSADGPPYWRPTGGGASSARLNPDEAQVIADRALAWYQPHRAEMHAALFERLLTISGEGGPLP